MFKKIVWLGFSSIWKNAKNIKDYIASLVESWAWEFFIWYNPSYWYEKFWFEVSPNGRFSEHEQITDYQTLKSIVEEVHNYNLEIFINLNAWYYTQETFPLIEKMILEFIEIKFDWIICWNIWILEYLKDINYNWKINISTIMAIYNRESIYFLLQNYKINKLILSREVTLKDIEILSSDFPNLKFEVFWEGDFCRYNNWLCFAEHKYWAKDICTILVNDLVIKKRFRPDYKEIILEKDLSNKQKLELMNNFYIDDFEKINQLLLKIDLDFIDISGEIQNLLKIIFKNRFKTDLYFDALQSLNNSNNIKILIYLRWIKFLLKNKDFLEENNINILISLEKELNTSFKSYILYNTKKINDLWWEELLKALELSSFYAKSDNLNLYTYLFFSKIDNIDTVKFPTRWRNYWQKIKLIDIILKDWKIDNNLIDRWSSLYRTHYDLNHIFQDKLWFRKFLVDNF